MWQTATHSLSRCARSSLWLPLVGLVALIAAFMATKGGGRSGPAPRSAAKRPQQSGGWLEPAILPRDVKRRLGGATENSRRTPLRGRTACRNVALSRRPWARPSPTTRLAPDRRRIVRAEYQPYPLCRSRRSCRETGAHLQARAGFAKLHAAYWC